MALLEKAASAGQHSTYARQLLQPAESRGRELQAAPAAASRLASQVAPVEPLTERELEVLALMAQGLKYKEISASLFITLNTVRFHVKGIYGKLNVNNRTQAIETARRLGLLAG
jgi:LuxR family maltose regulon positive regulatory protein